MIKLIKEKFSKNNYLPKTIFFLKFESKMTIYILFFTFNIYKHLTFLSFKYQRYLY